MNKKERMYRLIDNVLDCGDETIIKCFYLNYPGIDACMSDPEIYKDVYEYGLMLLED